MCGVKMENEKNFNEIMQHKFFKDNADNLSILFKYFTARIDLKNCGESDNNLIILENSDSDSVVYCPKWYKNYEGIGTVITSKKGCIDLKIKCVNEGILKIGLRGIDFKDSKNTRVPIYIDYTKFIINVKTFFIILSFSFYISCFYFSKYSCKSHNYKYNSDYRSNIATYFFRN